MVGAREKIESEGSANRQPSTVQSASIIRSMAFLALEKAISDAFGSRRRQVGVLLGMKIRLNGPRTSIQAV